MAASPTRRTLQFLRSAGFACQVVERWCPFSRRRIDLFGCIDIVALHPAGDGVRGVLGIQATSASNHAARRRKLQALAEARLWVQTGNALWVVSWVKRPVKRHARRKVWQPRIEAVLFPEES